MARAWMFSAAVLLGCGGAARPTAVSEARGGPSDGAGLVVAHAAGGPVLDHCVGAGARLFVLRPFALETWRFADGRPELEERAPQTGWASGLTCAGDPRSGASAEARVTVAGDRQARLPGLELALGPHGWRVTREGRPVLARATMAPLVAAAFDGRALWAADAHTLWRWAPGAGQPLRIPLPDALVDKPVESLFFEGPVLWVREPPDVGHPLNVDGPVATYVKPAGTLGPRPTGPLTLPVGGSLVQLQLGVAGATIDGAPWALEAPTAVLPWAGGLAVADATRVVWWRIESGTARAVDSVALGGPSVALFDAGETLLAAGAYGFVALTRSSSPPRNPPSAP